jgi:hypothetical protein
LLSDETVRSRIERAADGKITVLSPEEIARRYAAAQPVLVINLNSFTSGRQTREARSGKDIYYNVSGEAVNRSQSPLKDVRVIVTIYGFGDTIFDTQTVPMGTMQPNDKRPFSVRFSNFDDINNVSRYACDVAFER